MQIMLKSASSILLALILSNISTIAIGLAIPIIIAPEQYSEFVLCWSTGQLVTGISYEWMRIGILRYSEGADPSLASIRRRLLWQGFLWVSMLLVVISVFLALTAKFIPTAGFLSVIAIYGACQGAFEGKQARLRAQFNDFSFSVSWVLRAFFSLLLSVSAARITGNGSAAILGLAASYPLTLFVTNRLTPLPSFQPYWDQQQVVFLARYGFFAAVATIISLALPAVLRLLTVSTLGPTISGGVLLAADLSQKVVSVVGLAVSIIVSQFSIRTAEFGSEKELERQVRFQVAITAAFVVPAAIGFLILQAPFRALLIAEEYRETYSKAIFPFCLASGLLAWRMYGIDSLFAAFGKTAGAVWAPLVSVTVTALLIIMFNYLGYTNPQAIGTAYFVGVTVGSVMAIVVLQKVRQVAWPIGELIKISIASTAIFILGALPSVGTTIGDLLFRLVAGGAIYIGLAIVLNIMNCRTLAVEFWRKR